MLQLETRLMDEPRSALDPLTSQVFEELIAKLGQEIIILMVTHKFAQARRITDNAAIFWVQEGAG